jgi:HlyD family secretion protein
VWVLAAIAVGAALFVYVRSGRNVVAVGAATVERHNLARENSTTARVFPTSDFQAHAVSPGTVSKVYVHLGENVQAGQELVQMDDTEALKDLAAAKATLASSIDTLQVMQQGGTQDEQLTANANLSNAQTQVQHDTTALASLQALEGTGAASPNEVALAQQRLNSAKAHVDQLQAQKNTRYSASDVTAQKAAVAQAQAAVEAANAVYAAVNIHAPFAGTVYALPVTQYQFVPAGDTLVQVANLTELQIKAYFDEPEIGLLKAGQPVSIAWDAKPGQIWHGHVLQAPTRIEAYGGTRNVGESLISVDDAKGDLLPNTNVTVTVTEATRNNVLSLPREALHTEGSSDFVYRIVDGRLVQTPIQVGLTNLIRFEVVGGLNEGDLVALGATTEADLSNHLRVKVQR